MFAIPERSATVHESAEPRQVVLADHRHQPVDAEVSRPFRWEAPADFQCESCRRLLSKLCHVR